MEEAVVELLDMDLILEDVVIHLLSVLLKDKMEEEAVVVDPIIPVVVAEVLVLQDNM
tara:strand:+ start:55 stop:225 length:171 start_codon:yes stop_codon:yes gene_type:complete